MYTGGSGRDYITVLGCGSAIGERLVPYIVYKGKNLMTNHTCGGPPGTRHSMSDSGWMEMANFCEWFVKVFVPATADMVKTGPVILFFDGHKSHESLSLIEVAREYNISLYVFPPHTTHLLQPLDVGVFGPLKSAWIKVLKEYKLETMASRVDRQIFPSLIARIWDKVFLPEHLIGGFRAAGIHPLSRRAIPDSKLKTSTSFQQQTGTSSQSGPSTSTAPTSDSATETPVATRVLSFFGQLFNEKQNANTKLGKRGRTEPRHTERH